MAEDLVLDRAIRDWVLIPLSVVMVLIGVLRYFVSKLMRSSQVPDAKIIREGHVPLPLTLSLLIVYPIHLYSGYYHCTWILTHSSSFFFFGCVCAFCSSLPRQVILRARNLRGAANFIPPKSFRARRLYFSNELVLEECLHLREGVLVLQSRSWLVGLSLKLGTLANMGSELADMRAMGLVWLWSLVSENGLLHVPKGQAQNAQAQMFSDPNMAMDMMKKNLSMIIPQTLTFAWVNFFFSGFVAAKIPFPLTQRFRSMLQNGIDLSTVDVSYVSSRSWYFLNLFGLRGLFSLILGEENATDDTQRMMQMSGFGMDPTKSLGAEKDSLDIVQHEWALPKFEQRAEAVLRKLTA
ncbi:hypothetical protein Tsubulata_022604 [Turnera subulata]|uniref:ER membrane protein complex subunit 3 n=1 Tax=Turnera subulata TaxID=218843 RepID=A0A9Q0FDR3_9ROSI|nr:hypothetical protein Tsubulata_022604 [Turnera subulata]